MSNDQKADRAVGDALEHVRTAAQELHQAMSNTLAKRASATKADIENLLKQAKAADEAARSAMRTQQGAIKQKVTEAIEKLDTAQKHAAESLKSSGETFHASLTRALADVRGSVQKISEAVAAQRSERAAKQTPAKKAS